MFRFQSITALLALAMVLLPSLCRAHSLPAAAISAAQPADLPCHESTPATPAAPSHQKCCSPAHYPEAVLATADVVPPLSPIASHADDQFLCQSRRPEHSAYLTLLFSSPPNPGPLRI